MEEQAEFKEQTGGQCSWSLVNSRGERERQGRAEDADRGLILLGHLCHVLEPWISSLIVLSISLIPFSFQEQNRGIDHMRQLAL